jgi:serine phosphatase RsbU (regulator of sigma subunit)
MKITESVFKILVVLVLLLSCIAARAQYSLDRMENIPQKLSAENQLLKNYKDSIAKYDNLGNRKLALAYFKLYTQANDSIMNSENSKIISELNARYETQKKENEIKLLLKNKLIKDKEIAKQKVILYIVLGGIFVVFLLSILLFGRYRLIRKLNKQLDAQNELVARKNNLIVDSIDYAQRIQQSILPSSDNLIKHLPDAFILYKPKDIVSGDIYWFREKNNKLWLAAIDCTGHGVPGAMMSMVAYDLLHQSIRINKLEEPNEILKGISKGIQQFSSVINESDKIKDGMDIAMCRIDLDTLILKYSGAQNSIYIIRDKNIIELSADRVSIGLPEYYDFNFTSHTFQLKKGDWIYMFTDGFADQEGGTENTKYLIEPFRQLLLKNNHLPAIAQHKNIEMAFVEWKAQNEQTDDVLLIGVKI